MNYKAHDYSRYTTREASDGKYKYLYVIDRNTGDKYVTIIYNIQTGLREKSIYFDIAKPYKRELYYYINSYKKAPAKPSRVTFSGSKAATRFSVWTGSKDPEYPKKYDGTFTKDKVYEMLAKYPYRRLYAYGKAPKRLVGSGNFKCRQDTQATTDKLVYRKIQLVAISSDDEAYMYIPMDLTVQALMRAYINWLKQENSTRAKMVHDMYKYIRTHNSLRCCYKYGSAGAIQYIKSPI